jgi:FkbH-like protein
MTHITELPWLLRPPEGYLGLIGALDDTRVPVAPKLAGLTRFFLNQSRLDRLGKRIAGLQARKVDLAPLEIVTLGLVTNATSDFLANALRATAVRYGFDLRLTVAEFDSAVQEALDPTSPVNAAKPDLILLALDHRGLPFGPEGGAWATDAAQQALDRLELLRRSFAENARSTIMLQTVARPATGLFGSYDRRVAGTALDAVTAFNGRLPAMLDGSADLLVDVAALAETVGLATWHDPVRWHAAKVPFAMDCLPLWADHVCRVIAAWRGRSRKVLVLDLDNTMWGGIIGDDGIDGIRIGQGDGVGEAHLALQHVAKALSARGIVLAVCSKNEEAAARLPFREHPDMVLKENDFAAFVANWTDKASNLRAIANALNLGLDSLVFLDDNPVERDQVRQALPEVAVPEISSDPSTYASVLMSAGYFEAVAFSAEDRQRAAQYQQNLERQRLQVQGGSIDDYLKSLDMVADLRPFDDLGRARIAQLSNKTNQYNLTTLRCDENDVSGWQLSRSHATLQVRLVDKFGDNGMISVIIAEAKGSTWHIIQWLMSCRVLNRKVEDAVLNYLVGEARSRGIELIEGVYKPSPKNALVREHYRKLGFEQVGAAEPDGETRWRLAVATYQSRPVPMTVETLRPVGG